MRAVRIGINMPSKPPSLLNQFYLNGVIILNGIIIIKFVHYILI